MVSSRVHLDLISTLKNCEESLILLYYINKFSLPPKKKKKGRYFYYLWHTARSMNFMFSLVLLDSQGNVEWLRWMLPTQWARTTAEESRAWKTPVLQGFWMAQSVKHLTLISTHFFFSRPFGQSNSTQRRLN